MSEPTLPCELTKGVTATREGLVIEKDHPLYPWTKLNGSVKRQQSTSGLPYRVWKWPQAAKHLRYREGERWCHAETGSDVIICVSPEYADVAPIMRKKLHRLAALLCDGAEELRTLHWCIHNLGEDQNDD